MFIYVAITCATLIIFLLGVALLLGKPKSKQSAPTGVAPTKEEKDKKTKKTSGSDWDWKNLLLVAVVTVGIHYLLYCFLPEAWNTLAKNPFFWISQVGILLIWLFSSEVNDKGVRTRKIGGLGKLAICVLVAINMVQFFGPQNFTATKLKGMMPVVTLTPPASSSVMQDSHFILAPADKDSEPLEINWKRFRIDGGEDKILIKIDDREPVRDGRGVVCGRGKILRVKSITGSDVGVTVTFY